MTEPVRPPSSERERAERKLATVLFADLVSSTELAAAQDPERTRATLDRFYDAMADEISRAGGTVEKFAGDAVMAVFGVPLAYEDHVERALHAGLAMRRRLEELFGSTLLLRIGVNTGEVVVGRAREESSFVTGDAVNVAARLEQAAEPGDILVGERAAALVAGAFEFGAPTRVEAKGKPEGVPCRRLVRALTLMRPRGVPGLKRAFVGREHELDLVRAAYERVRSQAEPQLVTIVGAPGVGKTRLVRETWEWLGLSFPEALRRTGRCQPYGHAQTYAPIGEILKEHFEILDRDTPETVLALLGEREILALALGLDVTGDLHPIEARDRLQDAWLELVAVIAAEQPLALLVEDLHWAEESLLELLERTLLEVRAPVLVLATGRPEFLERSPTWGRARVPGEWVWLEPLGTDAVDRWLSEVVGAEPPKEVRVLLDRAEGNPLFLEELLGALLQRGVLSGDRWDETRLGAELAIPDTVQAVLAARIDLLPPSEKAALQAAAVIGRTFWPGAVRALASGDETDFRPLEQRDFIRRRPGSLLEGEREFVFKHALTQEVAYGSLTKRNRAHMHADFAAWLEGHGGGRDEDAALLARHYAEALRPEDVDLVWSDEPERYAELRSSAVRWLRRSAELAAGRYEIDDALELLGVALGIAEDGREQIELLSDQAHVHTLRFDPEGFRASLEEALKLDPGRSLAADIYAQLAYYGLGRPYMWKQPPAREVGAHWLEKALELSEPGTRARGFARLAQVHWQPLAHRDAATEAREIGEALGDPDLLVDAYEALTFVATEARLLQEAREWMDLGLDHVHQVADPGLRNHQYWNAVFVYARAGRVAEARRLADVVGEKMSSLGPHDAVHALAVQVVLHGVLGEWQALAELVDRVEAATSANEDFPCQFNWRNYIVCALGLAQLGEEQDARRLEELARSIAVVSPPPEREPALLRLALLRGDLDEARRILELLSATQNPFSVDAAAARLDAVLALGKAGRVEDEAAAYIDEESYTRPFALRALGLCRGDVSSVRRAESEFEAMGLAWRAEETRQLLAGAAMSPRQ